MAYEELVNVDQQFVTQVVQDLEAEGIEVALAFWAKLEEYGEWRFFLASPDFDRMGLFQAYGRIAAAGHAEKVFNSPIITVLDMNSPIVSGLKGRTPSHSAVRGVRVAGQAFGPHSIEDGYLEKSRNWIEFASYQYANAHD